MDNAPADLHISPPRKLPGKDTKTKLQKDLEKNSDVAFAFLAQVLVPGHQAESNLVLFVWLRAGALRSMRHALNLVSEGVARALPKKEFLDVVILNSAPELLSALDLRGELLCENDSDELARAREALQEPQVEPLRPTRPGWWPFG